jgi:hypothetical protein
MVIPRASAIQAPARVSHPDSARTEPFPGDETPATSPSNGALRPNRRFGTRQPTKLSKRSHAGAGARISTANAARAARSMAETTFTAVRSQRVPKGPSGPPSSAACCSRARTAGEQGYLYDSFLRVARINDPFWRNYVPSAFTPERKSTSQARARTQSPSEALSRDQTVNWRSAI